MKTTIKYYVALLAMIMLGVCQNAGAQTDNFTYNNVKNGTAINSDATYDAPFTAVNDGDQYVKAASTVVANGNGSTLKSIKVTCAWEGTLTIKAKVSGKWSKAITLTSVPEEGDYNSGDISAAGYTAVQIECSEGYVSAEAIEFVWTKPATVTLNCYKEGEEDPFQEVTKTTTIGKFVRYVAPTVEGFEADPAYHEFIVESANVYKTFTYKVAQPVILDGSLVYNTEALANGSDVYAYSIPQTMQGSVNKTADATYTYSLYLADGTTACPATLAECNSVTGTVTFTKNEGTAVRTVKIKVVVSYKGKEIGTKWAEVSQKGQPEVTFKGAITCSNTTIAAAGGSAPAIEDNTIVLYDNMLQETGVTKTYECDAAGAQFDPVTRILTFDENPNQETRFATVTLTVKFNGQQHVYSIQFKQEAQPTPYGSFHLDYAPTQLGIGSSDDVVATGGFSLSTDDTKLVEISGHTIKGKAVGTALITVTPDNGEPAIMFKVDIVYVSSTVNISFAEGVLFKSYCPSENVALPDGVIAYWCKSVDKDTYKVTLQESGSNIVPKGTGVLLRRTNTTQTDYELTTTDKTTDVYSKNIFVGTIEGIPSLDRNVLVFSKVGGVFGYYRQTAGKKINPNSSFLEYPAGTSASMMQIVFEDDNPTPVDMTEFTPAEEESTNKKIYTANGVQVRDMSAPGIYIVNGKKIIKK